MDKTWDHMSSILAVAMVISLPESALLVKLFYEYAIAAIRESRRWQKLRQESVSPERVRDMISRIKNTESLCFRCVIERKSISAQVVLEVLGCCRAVTGE